MQKKVITNRQLSISLVIFLALIAALTVYYFGRWQMFLTAAFGLVILYGFFKAENYKIIEETEEGVKVYLDKTGENSVIINDDNLVSWSISTQSSVGNFVLTLTDNVYSMDIQNINGVYAYLDKQFHKKNTDYIQQEALLNSFRIGGDLPKMSWKEIRAAKKKLKEMENKKNEG